MGQFSFELNVYVQRRPHLRDDNLEMVQYVGRSVLDQIFDKEQVDESVTSVKFYYPERWLNIVEERSLCDRLQKYCPNLELVEIITQSVYIIQGTKNEHVKILCSEDEIARQKEEGCLTQESSEGRLWYKNASIPDFSKLQVL